MSDTSTTRKGSGVHRISFSIDLEAYPELAYIFDLKGHGRRPQEFLRLALLGAAYDEAAKRLISPDANRAGGLPVMWAPSVSAMQAAPAAAPAPQPQIAAPEQPQSQDQQQPSIAPQPQQPASQPPPLKETEPKDQFSTTAPVAPERTQSASSSFGVDQTNTPSEPKNNGSSGDSNNGPSGGLSFLA